MRILRRKRTGGILILLARDRDTFYVEAESNEFRVWRITRFREVADEYFDRFAFWSWFIEAIPSTLFLKFATYFMRL